MEVNDHLFRLDNQLCFPLYAVSREVISTYRPFLEEVGISYPQYLVLMVLWESGKETVTGIGDKLFLDTGTLTPLLKRMEVKGLIERKRKTDDKRVVEIKVTEMGKSIKADLGDLPVKMMENIGVEVEDLIQLRELTKKVLIQLNYKL